MRRLVNRAWIMRCSRGLQRFKRALGRVRETQEQYLLNLVRRNAQTRFGEAYGFAQIRSIADYQDRVPIASYEAFIPHIEAIAQGQARVLTEEPVTLFQPTSGSTVATKLIPWTAAAAGEFQNAISPWIASLYGRKPKLLNGTTYWSLSPPGTALRTHGVLPVGFAHDADYLGFVGGKLFSVVSSVPGEVAHCSSTQEFRTRTLVALLADEDLGLISIWSPTFLTSLLEHFLANQTEILERFSHSARSVRLKRRAEFLKSFISNSRGDVSFEQVWPELQVISCWTDGPSEVYAKNLRRLFPSVEIQGKGLVATEAFISLPFFDEMSPVLAVNSHFFEFQDPKSRKILLAHELVEGAEYCVIVTTGGGLYRYALGDRVLVTGFAGGAPCLRFLGREGNISDLFGEKLSGTTVAEAVNRVLASQGIQASFFLVAPADDAETGLGYVLFLAADVIADAARLRNEFEVALEENFHYSHCRRLGQLSPARVFMIARQGKPAEAVFQARMAERGMKLGDIKPIPLDNRCGWENQFAGRFAA